MGFTRFLVDFRVDFDVDLFTLLKIMSDFCSKEINTTFSLTNSYFIVSLNESCNSKKLKEQKREREREESGL